MTGRLPRTGTVALTLGVGFGLLVGCTGNPSAVFTDKGVPAGSFQLVGFSSCDDALRGLRNAAKAVVGPYGFGGGGILAGAEGDSAAGSGGQPAPPAAGPGAAMDGGMKRDSGVGGAPSNYSGTNTHEAGVDEPDLVKTDGRRIVTVSAGVLRVVDAASRSLSGYVELSDRADPNDMFRYAPADLLIAGDHALVLLREQAYAYRGGGPVIVDDRVVPPPVPGAVEPGLAQDPDTPTEPGADPPRPVEPPIYGPRLLLVDISGQPQVLASYRIDGGLVDARQVGATARVVIRSYPRLVFPYVEKGTDANRTTNNKKIIDKAGLDEWLPRIETTTGGSTSRATVNCDAIARPATYTGTNMLTVLTFDLAGNSLGDGRPTTIVADGDTVYSNGPSLYVASDQRWRVMPMFGRGGAVDGSQERPEARTEIYKFETSGTEPPRFVAGGSVPGYLINQYAMSELDGKLRVAATSGEPWADPSARWTSQSGVYVLEQSRNRLREIGKVEGLGKGERIYAVRFVGTLGYVVTFRQTDPLYTVDVSDPTKPRVRGELKITGYSAYLHPAGGDKLIGIGQEATDEGRVTGTQVSLFSIADADKPTRLARYYLSGAHSEAEFDPHAFLYWPASGLLVVPLQVQGAVDRPGGGGGSGGSGGVAVAPPAVKMVPTVGALVLRVTGDSITELGFIRHPSPYENQGYPGVIRRSLVIDQTLWTVSDGGLMATDSRSLNRLAWIPFN